MCAGPAHCRGALLKHPRTRPAQVAFLWELVSLGYDVLISDLDVVWLSGGWERWMSYRVEGSSPLPEAAMLAMGDVLVSTDEV